MKITADKRSIRAVRQPEAETCLAEGLAKLRDLQIRLARAFAQIDASAAFVFSGCASIVEYGRTLGYSAFEARTLTHLGKTLAAVPDAEARVRDGDVKIEAAAAIGRIVADPDFLREGDDWLQAAASEPLRVLRRRIRERVELQAQGETGIEEVTVFVRAKTKDDFERAREVASQKAGKTLTDGQTFHRVVDFYLEKNDPLRAGDGTRRVGPTDELPGSRYVPAEVRRAIWTRAAGTCEVDTCERRHGLEFAHRTPHANGSGREVDDLGLLCRRHHLLYDAGRLAWPLDRGDGASLACERGVRLRPSRGPPRHPRSDARVSTRRASTFRASTFRASTVFPSNFVIAARTRGRTPGSVDTT